MTLWHMPKTMDVLRKKKIALGAVDPLDIAMVTPLFAFSHVHLLIACISGN